MRPIADEMREALISSRDQYLVEQLRAAGPGFAIGYRMARPPEYPAGDFRTGIRYETHLVELDADGQIPFGLAGFHYVTLRDHA